MRSRQNVASLYQQANQLKLALQNDLRALETQQHAHHAADGFAGGTKRDDDAGGGAGGAHGGGAVHVADVRQRVGEFEQCLDVLGQLAETSPKKVLWTSRHRALTKELWAFHKVLSQHAQQQQVSRYQLDHQALMAGGLASVVIQEYQDEADSLKRSDSHLESYLEQGENVLADLRAQRERIRGVGGKMRDILGSIGVSRSLLRLAERQNSIDRYTVYGGIAVVMLVFYVTYYFDTSVARFNLI